MEEKKKDYTVKHIEEFYSLDDIKEPKIGCLMMVKNEQLRIEVSLESVLDTVCCYIILDTGSSDSTEEKIIDFCKKHKKNLYLIEAPFVNFCITRNISLTFADTINVSYLCLLDCNDQLKGGEHLKKFALSQLKSPTSAY